VPGPKRISLDGTGMKSGNANNQGPRATSLDEFGVDCGPELDDDYNTIKTIRGMGKFKRAREGGNVVGLKASKDVFGDGSSATVVDVSGTEDMSPPKSRYVDVSFFVRNHYRQFTLSIKSPGLNRDFLIFVSPKGTPFVFRYRMFVDREKTPKERYKNLMCTDKAMKEMVLTELHGDLTCRGIIPPFEVPKITQSETVTSIREINLPEGTIIGDFYGDKAGMCINELMDTVERSREHRNSH